MVFCLAKYSSNAKLEKLLTFCPVYLTLDYIRYFKSCLGILTLNILIEILYLYIFKWFKL